jgi:hypothetical protein
MRGLIAASALAAVLAALSVPAQCAPRSQSGPRGPSGGVEFAPVDLRGPTLPPDGSLTPDSAWNGSGSAGVAGPAYSPNHVLPLFAPPAAPAPQPKKHKPYIILNQ